MTGQAPPPERDDDVAPPGEVRASHEDRDRVADLLRIAAGDGRLTADELDQRLEQALTARTLGELAALSRDLPPAPGLVAGTAPARPKKVIRIERQGGNAKREGRWVVPERIEAQVGWGHVTLDFTRAVIAQRTLQIDAEVRSGTLTLLILPGIDVDADDVAVLSSGSVKIRAPQGPQEPVILRIILSGTVRSGHIRARLPRRTPWRRFRRRSPPRALAAP
jgi:hypothetical protein